MKLPIESERRAPIVARSTIGLQAAGFRKQMQGFERELDGLDPDDRRLVRTVVGRIVVGWIGEKGPSHRMLVAEVAIGNGVKRLDVFCEPHVDHGLWRELMARIQGLEVPWAPDRRRPAGIWLDLSATESQP